MGVYLCSVTNCYTVPITPLRYYQKELNNVEPDAVTTNISFPLSN